MNSQHPTLSEAAQRINPLSQEARDTAYRAARERIAGQPDDAGIEPVFADYERNTIAVYPKAVSRLISVLTVLMLVGAFIPSAMRLYEIGKRTFIESIADVPSVTLAAICIVLMAEIGQTIFSLAAVVNAEGRTQKIALWGGAVISTAIALSGNAVLNQAHALENVFAFLETFAPPVLVLITAQVLKMQLLHAVKSRYEARQRFESDLTVWKQAKAESSANYAILIENAPSAAAWDSALANALWEALKDANRQSKAVLRNLTPADRIALVRRERSAEEWWIVAVEDERKEQAEALAAVKAFELAATVTAHENGNGHGKLTGEAVEAVSVNSDGTFAATCPHCGKVYTKESRASATNALTAHLRGCKVRKGEGK